MGRIVAENKHKGKLYPVDSKAIYRVIYEVVAVLPTENIKTSVIYCLPIIGKDNEYDMYLYIDGWAKIGSGSIDLSDYYTKEEVDGIVADISTLSFKIVQEKPIEDIDTNIIYLIPKSGSSAGNIYEEWIYIDEKWELLGTTDIDLSSYMTLAPLNPTAEQIATMPSGQLYGDTVNYKGIVKGGQQFYDSSYIDGKFNQTPKITYNNGNPSTSDTNFKLGDIWVNEAGDVWTVVWVNQSIGVIRWERITRHVTQGYDAAPATVFVASGKLPEYKEGDLYIKHGRSWNVIDKVYMLSGFTISGTTCTLAWLDISSLVDLSDYYTKTEIDTKIGDIGTALDTLNGNIDMLNTNLSEV